MVWCGASALIYGLAFFLMLSGFIRRNKNLVIVSFLVIFLYGSLVWGLYPKYAIENHISWEGHLAGFVMGIILAIFYKNEGPQREKPDDTDDDDDLDDEDPYWNVPEPPKEELTQPRYFRRH